MGDNIGVVRRFTEGFLGRSDPAGRLEAEMLMAPVLAPMILPAITTGQTR